MSLVDRILVLASARRDSPSARREIEDIAEAVRKLEASATDSVYALDAINRRRLADKKRQVQYRLARKQNVSAKKPDISILDSQLDSEVKKERKSPAMAKNSTGDLFATILPADVPDDWPDDYALQFWDRWPRHPRKHSQKQLFSKLASVRKKREATWAQIWGGLDAYLASDPEHKFIPCPLVWVNQSRWMASYDRPIRKKTFGDVMMGRG